LEKWSHHYFDRQYLEYIDLVITPLIIAIIFFVVNNFKRAFVSDNNPLKSYLVPALSLKVFGAMVVGLVYQFYYHGGDTMDFYISGSFVGRLFFDNFSDFLGLMNASPLHADPSLSKYYFLDFIGDTNSWNVVRFVAVLDIISFDSYPVISIYFSLFSLFASWKFFSLICQLYPQPELRKKFAYCIFYIPSVIFWGSGIFKDTLTLGGLFLFTVYFYLIAIKQEIKPVNFVGLAIGLYLMFSIRLFFLIILLPCLALWLIAEYRDKIIKSRFVKAFSFPVLLLISFFFITFGLRSILSGESELSSKALEGKAVGFQAWHTIVGGSVYDLGIVDFSNASLIRAFPLCVNVSFFRPYIWESHSFFQLIAAFQSFYFLYYTIRTIWRCKLSIFVLIATDPLMLFSITFSLLYAFVAGFTSYNFGALDRYKIPALPFFMITLVLVNFYRDAEIKKTGRVSNSIA
jgi:hypothetical protein